MTAQQRPEGPDGRSVPASEAARSVVPWPTWTAWLPIFLLLAAMIVLWALDLRTSYESPHFLVALNFVFSTLASLFVAYLVSRSFLVRATPGLLLLGCGMLIWGGAGFVGASTGLEKAFSAVDFANLTVTIHNTCALLSALCHLAGVALSLQPRRRLRTPGLWLALAYSAAIGSVALVAILAVEGRLPVFFIQGQGGTLVRQIVLISAVAFFGLAAALLRVRGKRHQSPFAYWYAMALALISAGLFGVLIQSVFGSLLGWTGRVAQYLGGVYMVVAAMASVRESRVWGVSLETALEETESILRSFFDSPGLMRGIVELVEGDILHISDNQASADFFGRTRESMREQFASEMGVPVEDARFWIERYEESRRTGRPVTFEYAARVGGAEGWLSPTVSYLGIGPTGRPRFAYAVLDITARKRAEEALLESDRRLREANELLEAVTGETDVIIATVDTNLRYTFFNKAYRQEMKRLSGKDIEIGMSLADVLAHMPGQKDIALREWSRMLRGETVSERIVFGDPAQYQKTYSVLHTPLRDAKGEVVGAGEVAYDISKQVEVEEALRRETGFVSAVLDTAGALVVVLDRQGRITRFNRACEETTGYSAEEVSGRVFWEFLIPPEEMEGLKKAWEDLFAGEFPNKHENDWLARDGSRRYIAWSNTALLDEKGGIRHIVATGIDITDRKRAEEERAGLFLRATQARLEAESANRAKDEFLAVLSHELRTPLTAVLGWTKMLQSGRLNERAAARGLEVIEQNVKSQARLIEDLLDVSRIIAGKLKLEKTIVDLASITRATVESLRVSAQEKLVALECELEADSVPFEGDAARLEQVVWNLVSNAIKFTPGGGRVDVTLASKDRQAILTVADTGVGVKAEFLPRLFDRFTQEDSSTSRKYTGLGLGLAIVRSIVDLHGGTVEARSAGEGKGAIFTVKMPLTVPAKPMAPEHAVGVSAGGAALLEGVKVLFVEDDPDLRELVAEVLRMAGADCELAADAREALERFERFGPDVVVSDIGLPGEDGYALIRRIRAWEKSKGCEAVPAIAVTGYAQVEDHMRVRDAGYARHLAKPVEPDALIRAIISIRRGRR